MAGFFIEAENFEDLGGWIVEQQSMRQVGSSYIMAHGLGNPVKDAGTTCHVPNDGQWTFWVRTRDWTAVWKRGNSGGRFNLMIDGKALPETLGTNGSSWDWQKAGTVRLEQGNIELRLHDLTGFNGRCDAIYATDGDDVPVNEPGALEEFRREMLGSGLKDYPETADLVIAGGGVAGICTAISAVQEGLKVILVHDREILGGCNSSEIRVSMGGTTHADPYMKLGNTVGAIEPIMGSGATYSAEFYEDSRKKNIFRLLPEDRYHLALNEHVVRVEKDTDDADRISAVISKNVHTGEETRFKARLFADCTGDGVIARMMGAKTMYGQEGYGTFKESLAPEEDSCQVMGMSIIWTSAKKDEKVSFPDIDWGVEINEDNAYYVRGGDWEWECGQYDDQAEDAEYIRDYGLMTVFANWSYIKNHGKRKDEWANDTIDWVTPIGGKRESYRIVGDLILTQNDIEERVDYPDKTGAMTWNIDLHFPDPENEEKFKEPFRSCAYHRGIIEEYPVPYRCLYSKDVRNLFLGGRIISASHIAFSCIRVMRTLGTLGEVVGMAAGICKRHKADPRDVYTHYLDELIAAMEKGVEIPGYHGWPCSDYESYHFKDKGHIQIHPEFSIDLEDRDLCRRIKKLEKLGVEHRYDTTKLPG